MVLRPRFVEWRGCEEAELRTATSGDFEDKFDAYGLAAAHAYLAGRFASFSVVRLNCIFPGRNVGQFESAIRSGNSEKRVIDNTDVSKHPNMDVAFEPKENFRAWKEVFQILALRRLGSIGPSVSRRGRGDKDIVHEGIGVPDEQLLTSL
jgi:hypothetical protein